MSNELITKMRKSFRVEISCGKRNSIKFTSVKELKGTSDIYIQDIFSFYYLLLTTIYY